MNARLYQQQVRSGFTIVELLIIIVVIAILAAISVIAYNGIQERARTSSNQHELAQIEREITTWALQENDESIALGPLLARQEGAGEVELTSALTGRPDITMYVVYDVTDTSAAYASLARLTPSTAQSNVFQMRTGASGNSILGYRIDTSAQTNTTGSQTGIRTAGSRAVGWLQVSDNATTRAFAYNQATSHTTATLSSHEGWSFTGLETHSGPSGDAVAAFVFNAAHDATTRAQVLNWLADTYDIALTF